MAHCLSVNGICATASNTQQCSVAMILPKLRNVDVKRLSGGATAAAAAVATANQDAPAADSVAVAVQSGIARRDQVTVDAARARYLNRKAAKVKR